MLHKSAFVGKRILTQFVIIIIVVIVIIIIIIYCY